MKFDLYFATNRRHEGPDRWKPKGYSGQFSDDGMDNLRFGYLTVDGDPKIVDKFVSKDLDDLGQGDGESLAEYFAKQAKSASISAYRESPAKHAAVGAAPTAGTGSAKMFEDIYEEMKKTTDAVIYIHGFNVSWTEAVGSALALQELLRRRSVDAEQRPRVILFSWPSDGKSTPFVAYRSDRQDAKGSGAAVGRAMLKLRDFLIDMRKLGLAPCQQELHLVCHSMGNYVLQNALERLWEHTPGTVMPRLFENVFLCAPDVDDDVLEPDEPLGTLHQLATMVTVYHNRGDTALAISDKTKGNPDRLGQNGAARPNLVHSKVHQADCSRIVSGIVEHSYYLNGLVLDDIGLSIVGRSLDDEKRRRRRSTSLANVWTF